MMQFEIPKERPSIIKVIGVGGGGSNAVNYMYRLGIKGVDFLVCNTDHQSLEISPVPHKIQLGTSLTEGRGAGAIPEVGKNAAIENIEEIRHALRENTRMVFITAGMGGGTGTGAAPIIAGVAKEMGILTVGIVTVPFAFEGKKRKAQADAGIEELKKNVDTLLIICNDKLREIYGDLKLTEAFGHADSILSIAAKSIAETISITMRINVDFADIQTVMKNSGVAIMGSATAAGETRAMEAVKKALDSPLLNDNDIEGARYILLNITSGSPEVTMDEIGEITDFIQEKAGMSADVIMGVGNDESLGEHVNVTIVATGFKTKDQLATVIDKPAEKIVYDITGKIISENSTGISAFKKSEEPAAVEPVAEKVDPNEPVLIIREPVVKKPIEILIQEKIPVAPAAEPAVQAREFVPPAPEVIVQVREPEPVIVNVVPPVPQAPDPAPTPEPVAQAEPEAIEEIIELHEIPAPVSEHDIWPVNDEAILPEHDPELIIFTLEEDLKMEAAPATVTSVAEPSIQETASQPLVNNVVSEAAEIETPVIEKTTEPPVEVISQPEIQVVAEPEIQAIAEPEIQAIAETEPSAPTFVFEINDPVPAETEVSLPINQDDKPIQTTMESKPAEAQGNDRDLVTRRVHEQVVNIVARPVDPPEIHEDDPYLRAKERINQLKAMSMKMNAPGGVIDLEKEPAYKRRNIQLDHVPSAEESPVSRFTLTNDAENKPEIKSNNSFLHDRVD